MSKFTPHHTAPALWHSCGRILPGLARDDLVALTDELALLIAQIPDERMRAQARNALVRLNVLHGEVVDALDRTAMMAALDWRLLSATTPRRCGCTTTT